MRISDWSSDVCSSDLHAHDLAGESAIDRKVIGGDLDVRGVADLDEGDVARGDARFDEQFVAERHNLHDLFARIHIAAQGVDRSEEHTSELQSLMRISYAVFCLKKKNTKQSKQHNQQ